MISTPHVDNRCHADAEPDSPFCPSCVDRHPGAVPGVVVSVWT